MTMIQINFKWSNLSKTEKYWNKFYSNKNGVQLKTIEWKVNRAVFFSRKEKTVAFL